MSYSFKFEINEDAAGKPVVDKRDIIFKELIFTSASGLALALARKIPYIFVYRCLKPKQAVEEGVDDLSDEEFNPFFGWLTSASKYLDATMDIYLTEEDYHDNEHLLQVSMEVMDRILATKPWDHLKEYFHYSSGELVPVTPETIKAMKEFSLMHEMVQHELLNK